MDNDKIDTLRQHINEIDQQIVSLIDQRATIALEVGRVKDGSPIYDPHRELEVLTRIVALSQGPLPKGALEDIYASIISACRELQFKE